MSFPDPSPLAEGHSWVSGEPGCCPAVARSEGLFSPLPVPFPGFLNYSILTQKVLFTKHSPYPFLPVLPLELSKSQASFPGPVSSPYCFNVDFRLVDPSARFLAYGLKQSCESLQIVVTSCANSFLPFYKQPRGFILNLFSLLFDIHFKNNKHPELDC